MLMVIGVNIGANKIKYKKKLLVNHLKTKLINVMSLPLILLKRRYYYKMYLKFKTWVNDLSQQNKVG
jgi:hypothetical protein